MTNERAKEDDYVRVSTYFEDWFESAVARYRVLRIEIGWGGLPTSKFLRPDVVSIGNE